MISQTFRNQAYIISPISLSLCFVELIDLPNERRKCIPKIRLVPFTLQKRFHLNAVLLKRQFPTKKIQVKIPALQLFPECSHAALQLIHHRGLNRERERKREGEEKEYTLAKETRFFIYMWIDCKCCNKSV